MFEFLLYTLVYWVEEGGYDSSFCVMHLARLGGHLVVGNNGNRVGGGCAASLRCPSNARPPRHSP